jgi:hypothetical protein
MERTLYWAKPRRALYDPGNRTVETTQPPDDQNGPLPDPAIVQRPYISGDYGPASGASKAQMVQITCPDGTGYKAHAKFAQAAEYGTRGLASEVLASRLGGLIGARVPAVAVVDLPEGQEIKLGDGSRPAPGLAAASETIEPWVDVNGPEAVQDIPPDDLALLSTIESWTEVGDRGHNMIRSRDRVYSIDYVSAFQSSWSATQPPGVLADDPLLRDRLAGETAAMRAAANKLDAVTDDDIDRAVAELPNAWMDDDTKARFRANLKDARQLVAAQIRVKYPQQ